MTHRRHRRCHPHPARPAQRQAQGLAPRRPRRRDAEGAGRAHRHRPGDRRRRRDGLRDAGRRAGGQRRPQRRARRRLARDVPGTTVDRQCGSSQQAAHFAAQGVIAGAYDVVVAAGVEVMTRVPMGASMADGKFGFPFGPTVGRPLRRPGRARAAGHLRRADRRQVGHHPRGPRRVRRALAAVRRARATAEGRFEREILPVLGADGADGDGRRGPARHDDGVARPS